MRALDACRVAIREEALDQLLTHTSALFVARTNDPEGGFPFWYVPPAGFITHLCRVHLRFREGW